MKSTVSPKGGYRALWLAVLSLGLKDAALEPDEDYADLAWVGSRDFRRVCDLADVDHNYVSRKFNQRIQKN